MEGVLGKLRGLKIKESSMFPYSYQKFNKEKNAYETVIVQGCIIDGSAYVPKGTITFLTETIEEARHD